MEDELNIYTTLEDAKKEIWRRWNDVELRKKVEDFLGGDIPEPFKKEPRAMLFREIGTPDYELINFINISKKIEIKPFVFEYLDDEFCTRNLDKVGLGRMLFFHGRNRNGEAMVSYRKIFDLEGYDNAKFKNICTSWGEKLADFHHGMLKAEGIDIELFDASLWLKNNGRRAENYYNKLIPLFICHGILFENYLLSGDEKRLTEEIFLPIFKKITQKFGCRPLIIPVIPEAEMNDLYWWSFPDKMEKEVLNLIEKENNHV